MPKNQAGQFYPQSKLTNNMVQHRHFNERVRQSVAALGDDKPLNDDDSSLDKDVRELNTLKGVVQVKSAFGRQMEAEEGNNLNKGGRRLDWRLGQKINALMDTGGGMKSGIVLGKGTAKHLKFEWLITPWSECSQPCGTGKGFRVSGSESSFLLQIR